MSRTKVIEEEDASGREFTERLSGYVTPEQKAEWDQAVEQQRIAEKRRKLSNGEIFVRFLEHGIPSHTQGPTRKKRRG